MNKSVLKKLKGSTVKRHNEHYFHNEDRYQQKQRMRQEGTNQKMMKKEKEEYL
jgi:hypothetical protein